MKMRLACAIVTSFEQSEVVDLPALGRQVDIGL